MGIRRVLEYPSPALLEPSLPVDSFDTSLHALLDDLVDTMRATSSLGLAAPQIGIHRRVLVLAHGPGETAAAEFVNPILRSRSGFALAEERCLSLPGLRGNVLRAARVEVDACDRQGARFRIVLEGMSAVCLQHEVDHLDGRLFSERLFWWRRLAFSIAAARAARNARLGGQDPGAR